MVWTAGGTDVASQKTACTFPRVATRPSRASSSRSSTPARTVRRFSFAARTPRLTSFRRPRMFALASFSSPSRLLLFPDDTDRAGGFGVRFSSHPGRREADLPTQPLADLPLPKTAVLGLVTSKFPALEKSEDLTRRVHEAAGFLAQGSGTTKEEALQRCVLRVRMGRES